MPDMRWRCLQNEAHQASEGCEEEVARYGKALWYAEAQGLSGVRGVQSSGETLMPSIDINGIPIIECASYPNDGTVLMVNETKAEGK